MTSQKNDAKLPDWKCERFLVGELDESEMERIRELALHDDALKARLASLEQSNREILRRYPARVVAREIEERLAEPGSHSVGRTQRWRWEVPRFVWVPATLAALVAALLVLNPGLIFETTPLDPFQTRLKSTAAQLNLYRRTATGSERLEDRASVAEHDLILAEYVSDGQTYGLIVSVDGRGIITCHHPAQGDRSVLMAGGTHALEFAYELDDAPRWEIFILAFSKSSFDTDALTDVILRSPLVQTENLSADEADSIVQLLPLPKDISLSPFTLIKEVGDE